MNAHLKTRHSGMKPSLLCARGREGRFTMQGFRQQALEDDDARDKLKEFMEIAEELSEAWTPVLDQGYPFSKSFHEVVRDLIQWYGIVQNQTRR